MTEYKFPDGLRAIKDVYGDPAPYLKPDGTIHPSWERQILDYVYLPDSLPLGWDRTIKITRIRVHSKLTTILEEVFREIYETKLWDKLETFDGAYAWRMSRGSQKLSTHCWGIALDLNAGSNGLGTQGDMDPQIVSIFSQYGFEWGGSWRRPDPMHFQGAHGY